MATTFQALRKQAKPADTEPEENIKSAGVDAPLPSDEDELDDADENTRNADDESAEDMVTKAIKPIYKKRDDGSYTLNTEELIRQDQELVENAIDDLKKIATKAQAGTVKLKDGSRVKVDMTTANIVLSVHGALNKNNQVKFAQILAQDKAGFSKMSGFALKQGKLSNKMGLHTGVMS